ncbi:SNF2 N-terminal domain-containing protein [Caenorhabditis elegans]|uniref:SNF2 N-terminal domain-containing protein n=1 Tax=Caenorhabditis elegans TaxID=6239 RepID=O62078_CAEEL|nr:SNF2 N-terminal domain-containing protein [Caenorhabditis elegans]CAB03922.3 SNF2 N-terminal domain-containing protein [Caenorhabditis elegans]|eukprot:NP_507778.3 Uncharacterized protein CELE_C25F9.4 [Caenorhabditis elegans]
MGFELDEQQKNMMNSMAKYESGDNCGGIITIATSTNDRIEEVLISHIFEQNKTLQNGSKPNKTLMVGSPSWTNKLQKLPSKCKKVPEVPEECSENSKNDDISFYKLKKTTKSQDFANCKEDIVLANYGLLETIQELKVTWERIIFHDFSLETKNNYQQFETVCKLNATFRWYITENHKQDRLEEYLVADDGKRIHVKGDIDTFLDQANLYLPSAEPKSRNLKTPLDDRQKDFKSNLAQRENEPVRGGVITTLIRDILIKEAIIEFLLDRKNTSEEYGHSMGKTLLVVPPDMIESWKKLLEKLLEKDDLVIHYFYRNEDKKPDDSHEVVITTYDMLKNIENRNILWKRIIFEDNYSASEKDRQQYQLLFSFLCQLHAEYRWCLTENPTQQKLARFMNRKEYGESHNLIKSISLGNAKDDEEKSTAKLVKNIEGFLKQVTLRFPRSPNDYKKHITNAKKEKNENEPNISKFCNNMLAAIVSYTKEFYIKHFKICAESDEDIEEMYDSFCAGFKNTSDVGLIMKIWVDAHFNFSKSEQDRCFIGKTAMKNIIENFEKAIKIIEKATQTSIEESYNQMRAARSGKRPIEEVKASKA